ncbi:Phage integrase [Microbacterium esteraromaticum]|uniref:Phage integrase n=1 Tax=Microbacterium esteraromaticum TaxID=57043 RepID=A0A1R4JZ71_9MICO|nr:tyrosine-type recombinase/integrase [Microbacterium esteraromaticum]SJN37521.1 Phage integrase [Microbacterium esteraromaticum]
MASRTTPPERADGDGDVSQKAHRPRTRRRGRGSIQSYPTAEGKRWRYQIWVPVDPEQPDLGEKKFSRGGFATAADADAALQDALKQRDQQEKFGGKVPTLGVYADAWVEGLKLADSSIAGYKKIIRNHLRPQLGHYPLDKLTPTRIARHYRDLEQHGRKDEQDKGGPLSANTVHKAHVVLGAILDAAIEDGHIATNPAKRKAAKAPTTNQMRAEKPELVTWTADQLAALLAWDRDEKQDELFALWWVIANTGMRRSEALALKWNDLNTITSQISIRRAINTEDWTKTKTTKTGNARVIDIDAATVKVLASYKVARAELSFGLAKTDAYIFGDDDGQPRSPDAMTSRWDRRLKWAAKVKKFEHLPRVTLKGLRHTHATILMELGIPPKVVQERLGHSTITTTMNIYSHVTPTLQKNAVEQFASRLAGT